MTLNMLPRVATSPELAKLRRDNQSSKWFLCFLPYTVIYTARLAALPSSTDRVAQITYTSGSGTLADVVEDLTLYVGTTAGAYDLGLCRIRKTPTSSIFYIGEESEIDWQASAYLTVVNDVAIWPRHINLSGQTPLMDYEIAYTNQNSVLNPVPVLGPHAVKFVADATASVAVQFDASSSWVIGSTISSYAWTRYPTAGASLANASTATPTLTATQAGVWRVSCTVTAANGKTSVGHRFVFVFDDAHPPVTQFNLESVEGSQSNGGWTFKATMYAEAARSSVRDRALCILFARDWYGSDEGSIGYVEDRENIIALGWIADETIDWRSPHLPGSVAFEVKGPQYWLDRITAFPGGLRDKSFVPVKWTQYQGLTVNAGLFHFVYWRSTLAACCDVFANTDTKRLPAFEMPGRQTLWQQIQIVLDVTILAKPYFDRYGRMFSLVDQNYVPEADRTGIVNVMTLTAADWHTGITFRRRIVQDAAQVDLSGVSWDGATSQSLFSLSAGRVFRQMGHIIIKDRLLLSDQTQANELAGLVAGRENSNYPSIPISLASNMRLIDIAPYQWLTLAITSGDTPRGVTETLRVIPKSVRFTLRKGVALTEVEAEAETFAELGITGDTPPATPTQPIDPIPIPIPPVLPVPGPAPEATEIWFMLAAEIALPPIIVWANIQGIATGDVEFHSVAVPADFDTVISSVFTQFQALRDGSAIYLAGLSTALSGSRHRVWKCTNPRESVPVWEPILSVGDLIFGAQVMVNFENDTKITRDHVPPTTSGSNSVLSASVVSQSLHYAGVYDGGAWDWLDLTGVLTGLGARVMGVRNTFLFNINISGNNHRFTSGFNAGQHTLRDWIQSDNSGPEDTWRNGLVSGINYALARETITNFYSVRSLLIGAELMYQNFPMAETNAHYWSWIRGLLEGSQVQFVDCDVASISGVGTLHVAQDGVSFDSRVEWRPGFCDCVNLTDGEAMIWMPRIQAAFNEILRYSPNGFRDTDSIVNATGNFWTDIRPTGGQFDCFNMCVVYSG